MYTLWRLNTDLHLKTDSENVKHLHISANKNTSLHICSLNESYCILPSLQLGMLLFIVVTSPQSCFPQRYRLLVLSFLGFFNLMALRANFNIALVSMVNFTAANSWNHTEDQCPGDLNNTATENVLLHFPHIYSYTQYSWLHKCHWFFQLKAIMVTK